ncbi:MAG TPA: DUF2569 domain-containing protein [Hyphomicrobiaceae bacterium]|nr:DUF2569 domain-containing protein [Hyphomicrobiaceae bacterium]
MAKARRQKSSSAPALASADEPLPLKPLAGWLRVVAAGLVIAPLWIGYVTWSTFGPMLSGGVAAALGAVGDNPSLGPAIKWLLVTELLANTGLMLLALWALTLMLGRHRWFPRVVIGLAVLSLTIVIGDSLIAHRLGLAHDGLAVWDILRNAVTALILVPYMLISKRVRATFVEQA